MPFPVKDWQASPSTATPLSAPAMEDLETRLGAYVDQSVPIVNIKHYGALGDGTTDDLAAINAAITAAPTGGVIYTPPSTSAYMLSAAPTIPSAKRLKFIGDDVPRYDTAVNPVGWCKWQCMSGFPSAAMIVLPNDCIGTSFQGMAFVGNNQGTNVHGIKFPAAADNVGEQSVWIDNCKIAGFSGHGMTGRMHVVQITSSMITRNQGWGLAIESTDFMSDCWSTQNIWAFNKNGNIDLGGTATILSGHIMFTLDRFERAGNQPGNGTPFNTDAPGVRITRGKNITFTSCSTDANTGDGMLFQIGTGGQANVHSIKVMGGQFTRDAGAGQATAAPTNRAAFRVQGAGATGADRIGYYQFNSVDVGYGNPNDDGSGTTVSPQYAFILDNTDFVEIKGGRHSANTGPYSLVNSQWRLTIDNQQLGMGTISLDAPTVLFDGATWYDTSTNQIKVRNGSTTRSTAALT